MTLEQIKTKIGERVDDDSLTAYTARYEGLFITAITELVKLRDENGNFIYSAEEFPDLAKSHQFEARFSNKWFVYSFDEIDNIAFIRDVFVNPEFNTQQNITNFKNFMELQRMASNRFLTPGEDEIFWSKKESQLFLFSGATRDIPLSVDVILNPDPSEWGTGDLNYGQGFLEACITRAATILRAEIGLE